MTDEELRALTAEQRSVLLAHARGLLEGIENTYVLVRRDCNQSIHDLQRTCPHVWPASEYDAPCTVCGVWQINEDVHG